MVFEALRNSLMCSAEYEIFDDMLIGNFMRATLHGEWPESRPLYPDLAPSVAKYGDNGLAKSNEQLKEYFATYRQRMGIQGAMDLFQKIIKVKCKNIFRQVISPESPIYKPAKAIYDRLGMSGKCVSKRSVIK